jgi:hypothetical protein
MYTNRFEIQRTIQRRSFWYSYGRPRWPRGIRCRSAAAYLLGLWVRIPPGAWVSCRECCVLSGSGFCNELIPRPEESYQPWCVVVFDVET